jgi:exopolyphosphatase/guanosine-5'-triphosphate,3'-diphosphate pyrophosphatase
VVRSKATHDRQPPPPPIASVGTVATIIGAIDVGTNAVRLELARPGPDGSIETLHQERDAVRPGEGVFATGGIPREVANRLIGTLRRYAALARRHRARVRAVATSALREARNRDDIVRRAHDEAGLVLEVISGKEEARLICLGVLSTRPAGKHSCIIDIGGGSTEVATATGTEPTNLWSIAIGAVRLTELFDAGTKINKKQLKLMRAYAREAIDEALPGRGAVRLRSALGSSGTINTLVAWMAAETGHATVDSVREAVDELVAMGPEGRRRCFDPRRADIIVAGAIILEAVMRRLGLRAVTRTDRGLRDGVLVDLMRRQVNGDDDGGLAETAVALGRRVYFDEAHARQVSRLALGLFDDLAALHRLPAAARPLLEVAALLHDVGHAVSYQKHHKHSHYLIAHADLPGLADRERQLAALIARFHRRTVAEGGHVRLVGVSAAELNLIRKTAILLRIADSLDRSHHQVVRGIRAHAVGSAVQLRVRATQPVDLELWDAQHEVPVFRRILGKRLELQVSRR